MSDAVKHYLFIFYYYLLHIYLKPTTPKRFYFNGISEVLKVKHALQNFLCVCVSTHLHFVFAFQVWQMGNKKSSLGNNSNNLVASSFNIFRSNFFGIAQTASATDLHVWGPTISHVCSRSHPYVRGGIQLYIFLCSLYCNDR